MSLHNQIIISLVLLVYPFNIIDTMLITLTIPCLYSSLYPLPQISSPFDRTYSTLCIIHLLFKRNVQTGYLLKLMEFTDLVGATRSLHTQYLVLDQLHSPHSVWQEDMCIPGVQFRHLLQVMYWANTTSQITVVQKDGVCQIDFLQAQYF